MRNDKQKVVGSTVYEALPTSYQNALEIEHHGEDLEQNRELKLLGYKWWKEESVLHKLLVFMSSVLIVLVMIFMVMSTMSKEENAILGSAWASKAAPFSTVDPMSLGLIAVDRPDISKPGPIFGDLLEREIPLPTNSWYENFLLGFKNTDPENKVFQVPYVLDTAGRIPGVRTHPTHVQANNRAVMVSFDF